MKLVEIKRIFFTTMAAEFTRLKLVELIRCNFDAVVVK